MPKELPREPKECPASYLESPRSVQVLQNRAHGLPTGENNVINQWVTQGIGSGIGNTVVHICLNIGQLLKKEAPVPKSTKFCTLLPAF